MHRINQISRQIDNNTKQVASSVLSFEQCFRLVQNYGETQQKLPEPELETGEGRTADMTVLEDNIEPDKKLAKKSHA